MNIEVKNLEKKYKSFTAVNNINFLINEGKTLGLLGPNGCGKTTTSVCSRINKTFRRNSY